MTKEEERELRAQLARLQQEHRDLDAAIAALQEAPGADVIARADAAMYARKAERRETFSLAPRAGRGRG